MKTSRKKIVGMFVAGLLCVSTAPASAQLSTTANGPYYATPSWDQKLTTNRFVILANWNGEAVLDRETGLVWMRSPDAITARTWRNANAACNARQFGGRKGWRLPSAQELASLLDLTAPSPPLLPAGHPFLGADPGNVFYWTSTTSSDAPTDAWAVRFLDGDLNVLPKTSLYKVWCTRGGTGPDIQ